MSMFLLVPPALIELLFLCICGFASSHIQLVKNEYTKFYLRKLTIAFLRKEEKFIMRREFPIGLEILL